MLLQKTNSLSIFLISGLLLSTGLMGCIPARTPTEEPNGENNETQAQTIQVYFLSSLEDYTELEAVNRTTDRIDIANFAIEQLIAGPTPEEEGRALLDEIEPTGESICDGADFSLNIEQNVAVLQFCRDVTRVGGVGEYARIITPVRETLMQFDTVDDIVILDSRGDCFGDMSGENICFEDLPE